MEILPTLASVQENLVSIDLRPWLWLDYRAPDLATDGIDTVQGNTLAAG